MGIINYKYYLLDINMVCCSGNKSLGLKLLKVSTLENNKDFINLHFLQNLKWKKTMWYHGLVNVLEPNGPW